MAKHDYSDHPAVKAASVYVPKALIVGQPVAISRALLNNKAFFDAFKAEHGWTLAQALERGMVTLTDEAPPAPASDAGPSGA